MQDSYFELVTRESFTEEGYTRLPYCSHCKKESKKLLRIGGVNCDNYAEDVLLCRSCLSKAAKVLSQKKEQT